MLALNGHRDDNFGELSNGTAGSSERDAAMQLWCGAVEFGGGGRAGDVGSETDGEHHGLRTNHEHSAVWDVQFDCQSGGRCGDVRRLGRIDAAALRAGDPRTVGPRFADGARARYANFKQYQQVHVYLGRGDSNPDASHNHRDGSVTRNPEARNILHFEVNLRALQTICSTRRTPCDI